MLDFLYYGYHGENPFQGNDFFLQKQYYKFYYVLKWCFYQQAAVEWLRSTKFCQKLFTH